MAYDYNDEEIVRFMDKKFSTEVREEVVEMICDLYHDHMSDEEDLEDHPELIELARCIAGAAQTLHELNRGKVKLTPVIPEGEIH